MPNWKNFQDMGYRLTETDIDALVPSIMSEYDQAIKEINKLLQATYAKVLSAEKPGDYYNAMLKYDRLQKLLDQVTREYVQYSRRAGNLTGKAGQVAMSNNFYRQQYAQRWISQAAFIPIPKDLIQISVYGSKDAYKKYLDSIMEKVFGSGLQYYPQAGTLSEFLAANRLKEIENIRRAITQSFLTGQNYRKTANAVKDIIGNYMKDKDGNINVTGAKSNALRIVRTESARIMNDASLSNSNYARSEGIEVVRIWNATLDGRTRASHAALDNKPEDTEGKWLGGTVSGPGRGPNAGFNANCRCTTFESVNGSRPTLRNGRNPVDGKNEVFNYTDYETWATENGLVKNKFGEYVPRKK